MCTASARRGRYTSRDDPSALRSREPARARAPYRCAETRRGGDEARPWASPRSADGSQGPLDGSQRPLDASPHRTRRVRPSADATISPLPTTGAGAATRSEDSILMSLILVTGASGFVGSHAVPALLAAGHSVAALARTRSAGEVVLGRLSAADRSRVAIRSA